MPRHHNHVVLYDVKPAEGKASPMHIMQTINHVHALADDHFQFQMLRIDRDCNYTAIVQVSSLHYYSIPNRISGKIVCTMSSNCLPFLQGFLCKALG